MGWSFPEKRGQMTSAQSGNHPSTDAVCVVVGTRPGIIKMSPLVRELQERNCSFFVIHTGQHYSYFMDQQFFEDLELPQPEHHLDSAEEGSLHGEQTAVMLTGIEKVLVRERPRVVVVGGDANTNLAGALAARKLGIEVGHVEAGLRSFDWRMPEEHNRVMIDHISEHLFAPTKRACENLQKDWVRGKIYLTGNTIVEALRYHAVMASTRSDVLATYGIARKGYFLLTLHRAENVDSASRLALLLSAVEAIIKQHDVPVVFPCHPRTRKRLREFGLEDRAVSLTELHLIEPMGYLDFLKMEANAALVLTDSGGIQEESCILKVPCVTLRETTERQETVEVGSNIVAGLEPESTLHATTQMLRARREWPNPFGDGKAAKRIVDVLMGAEPEPLTSQDHREGQSSQ